MNWLKLKWRRLQAWLTVMRMHRDGAMEFRRRCDAGEPVNNFVQGGVRCFNCYGFHAQKQCPLRNPIVERAYERGVPKWWTDYLRWRYYPDIPFDNGEEEAPKVLLDRLAESQANLQKFREEEENK